VTTTDRLVAGASGYAARSDHDGSLPARPGLGVAVVTCMDCRIDPVAVFDLAVGDAHVIRNAGGLVTDDALRSLAISQRFLGTTEILLVHHTSCGMQGLDDAKLADELEAETGTRPSWAAGGFADAHEDVRRSIERVRADPFIPSKQVRGFVFDVATGSLEEVDPADG
jgi:carbonic anhydrase